MGTGTRTSHSLSEELGSELVTDGGFAAVTATNGYTSDFSVGVDDWGMVRGTVAGNIDNIGGLNDNLRAMSTLTGVNDRYIGHVAFDAIGSCYRLRAKYYIPSGQSNIDGIRFYDHNGASTYTANLTVTDAWTDVDIYINVRAGSQVLVFPTDAANILFDDAGGDDVFYLREVIADKITFTNFTAGTGWAPQATAGALTGKAQKVAGTASDLEQDVSAVAAKAYRIIHTATRTAGTETAGVGGASGAARSSTATFTDNVVASTTGNLKFAADASFAGNIDAVSCLEITRRGTPD